MSKVYICIATAQNTINVLPFYLSEYGFDKYNQVRIISSNKAKEGDWDKHFEKYIKNNRRNLEVITDENQLISAKTAQNYFSTTCTHFDEVIINIGGGTKAMSLNIILAINSLDEEVKKLYTLIYPNIENKTFDIYKFDSGFSMKAEKMKVHIPLTDILTCYGEENASDVINKAILRNFNDDFNKDTRDYMYAVINSGVNVFENYIDKLDIQRKVCDDVCDVFTRFVVEQENTFIANWNSQGRSTIIEKDFDEYFLRAAFYNKLLNAPQPEKTMQFVNGVQLEVRFEAFKKQFKSYNCGTFFEIIAQNRVASCLQKWSSEHSCDIKYNLKPKFDSNFDKDSELDIVLNNFNGDLLIFEIKTVSMSKKDFDAMQLKLHKYSGLYNQTYVLIPFFWEDFTSTSGVNRLNDISNTYLQNLINLPFDFQKNRIKFCVLSDNDKSYTLYKQKNIFSKNRSDRKINSSEPIESVDIISYKTIIDNYIKKYNHE